MLLVYVTAVSTTAGDAAGTTSVSAAITAAGSAFSVNVVRNTICNGADTALAAVEYIF